MRVFLDTNVLLDTLVSRDNPQFARNAATILSLGENGTFDLFMSALSVPTIAYVLKSMSPAAKKAIIGELVDIVKVFPALPDHVTNMLESQMSDVEDALQVQSAAEGGCDVIVTRNIHDFKLSEIPAISPEEFLRRILPPDLW